MSISVDSMHLSFKLKKCKPMKEKMQYVKLLKFILYPPPSFSSFLLTYLCIFFYECFLQKCQNHVEILFFFLTKIAR